MAVNGGFITGTIPKDNLIVGDLHLTDTETLAESQDLTRGAVLGRITTGGQMVLSDDGASDGSQVPEMILLEDAVTEAAETLNIPVLVWGQVNENDLNFGGTHDKDTVKAALKAVGIYLAKSRPA